MADYVIKAGDRLPALEATLQDEDGNPADLTGYTNLQLRWKLRPAGTLQTGTGSFNTDRTTGRVSYAWQATETDTPGLYDAEWRATGPGGEQQTWPTDGYFQFKIEEVLP